MVVHSLPAAANLAEMTEEDPDDALVLTEMPDEVISEDDETPAITEARSTVCTGFHLISDLSCTSVTSSAFSPACQEAFLVRELLGHKHRSNLQQRIAKFVQPKKLKPVFFPHWSNPSSLSCHRLDDSSKTVGPPCKGVDRRSTATEVATCFVSSSECPSLAILDTGASRCAIGENVWKQVLDSLPEVLQQQVRTQASKISFWQ